MRILLVGEYSNFHNSLKVGLTKLGHDVLICSDPDFKGYPNDISLYATWFKDKFVLNIIRQIIFRLFKMDFAQLELAFRFYLQRKKMTHFDIVQLVNEQPLQSIPFFEKKMISFLAKNNTKLFLVSCGDDYPSVSFMNNKGFRYSVLSPCLEDPTRTHCEYTTRFLKPEFKDLHQHVYQNISGVISGDLDYTIPLQNEPKHLGLIPYPIDCEKHQAPPLTLDKKIIIFHGINQVNYYKKGNNFFKKALEIVNKQYADKIEIITTVSIPYQKYIQNFDKAHIILDQTNTYDQGYNALEAMAKGKVVFTGAEKEFYDYYKINNHIAINALPDAQKIAEELIQLIENPNLLLEIGANAKAFVNTYHKDTTSALRYLETWQL